jgi:hypothetical protein
MATASPDFEAMERALAVLSSFTRDNKALQEQR